MTISSGIQKLSLLLILTVSACSQKNDPSKDSFKDVAMEVSDTLGEDKVKEIFYNLCLPNEMSALFERIGANYNPDLLNSADNFPRYDEKASIALNIGSYGVDLSYARLFGQDATTAKYLSTIQIMFEKLGIPVNYYEDMIPEIEKNYSNKDSLSNFAGIVFEKADQYLRENENNAYAALIITGGWIESLYIATKIAESNPDDIEIVERIAGQKYSLNSLISLLSNYQEDITITKYILFLKELRNSFENVSIYYNETSFKLDTLNKLISSSDYKINLSPEILREITRKISEIRSEMIN